MFEFLWLGLEAIVRVQRERAEAGALLRLCWKHISKTRNAVKRERARQPGEFFSTLGLKSVSSPFLVPFSRVRLFAFFGANELMLSATLPLTLFKIYWFSTIVWNTGFNIRLKVLSLYVIWLCGYRFKPWIRCNTSTRRTGRAE